MIGFSRRRDPAPLFSLGPLETQVLDTLWLHPHGAFARQVQEAMAQSLAYTTVTTTLDRLCKKNLVERSKVDRAFVYRTKFSRQQLDEFEAREAIQRLTGSGQLVSCLLDAVVEHDAALLDQLEQKIRDRRRALKKSGGAA